MDLTTRELSLCANAVCFSIYSEGLASNATLRAEYEVIYRKLVDAEKASAVAADFAHIG